MEGPGVLLHAVRQRIDEPRGGLVLTRTHRSRGQHQGPRLVLEGRQGRVILACRHPHTRLHKNTQPTLTPMQPTRHVLAGLAAPLAFAQASAPTATASAPRAPDAPLTSFPYTPVLDTTEMDTSAN